MDTETLERRLAELEKQQKKQSLLGRALAELLSGTLDLLLQLFLLQPSYSQEQHNKILVLKAMLRSILKTL